MTAKLDLKPMRSEPQMNGWVPLLGGSFERFTDARGIHHLRRTIPWPSDQGQSFRQALEWALAQPPMGTEA